MERDLIKGYDNILRGTIKIPNMTQKKNYKIYTKVLKSLKYTSHNKQILLQDDSVCL